MEKTTEVVFKMLLVDQFDEDCRNSMMDCGFTSNRAVITGLHWKHNKAFDKTMGFFLIYHGNKWQCLLSSIFIR